MQINNTKFQSKDCLREELLNAGTALASRPNVRTLSLHRVTELCGYTPAEVKGVFSSESNYNNALRTRLREVYDQYVTHSTKLDPVCSSFTTRITALARSYFEFAKKDSEAFTAFNNLSECNEMVDNFDADLAENCGHPLLLGIADIVRDEIRANNGPRNLWLWQTRTMAIFAAAHGISHLCAFGILRLLNDTAKLHVFTAIMNHVLVGVGDSLRTGRTETTPPHEFVAASALPTLFPAVRRTASPGERSRYEFFKAAINEARENDIYDLTAAKAARRADLSLEEVSHLIDQDVPFLKLVERYIDQNMRAITEAQMSVLPAGSSAISIIKSSGYAYVGCAVADPDGFDILVAIASGSIIPNTFEKSPENFEMGDTFEFLVSVVRQAIEDGDGLRSPMVLYENTMCLWGVAHGMANAYSAGPLQDLDQSTKFTILDAVLDISLSSMIHRLDLTYPVLEETTVER